MSIDHVKKFKMNVANKYLQYFSIIVEKEIFPKITQKKIKVINCYHLAERLIDRNVSQEFAVKILSYVFEHKLLDLTKNVDTFVHYKDVIFLLNCRKEPEGYSIRMNTMLKEAETEYIKSKGFPIQNLEVTLKDIMNYEPEHLKKREIQRKKM